MTRFDEAWEVAQEARQLAEDMGNSKWHSDLLGFSIALHHMRNGDLGAAQQSAQMGAEMAVRIGAAEQEGYACMSLGQIAWMKGEYELAIDHYQRSLQAGQTSGIPFIQATALSGLGTVHMDISGKLMDQTSQFHSQALEVMELPLGTTTGGLAWADLGFCILAAGNVDQAGQYFEKGLTESNAFKFLARPMLLVGSAFVALGRNDVATASALVQEAQEFVDERAMQHFYPLLSLADAQVRLASRDLEGALASFNRADDLAVEMGMRPLSWQARGGAAQVLSALGREAEASEKRDGALGLIHEIGGLFEDERLASMYMEDALMKLG
jgi:tetratricopeptide (TPR) repeat protein